LAKRYGVPVDALANKFSGQSYEPSGHTTNPQIREASSITDYVFRWMGLVWGSEELRAEWKAREEAKAALNE
jgi:ribonucleoside-diphosphate reductase alpha chain